MYSIILYDIIAIAVAGFVVFSSYRASRECKRRLRFLIELEDYCLELRHRYGQHGILADAVFASFDPDRKAVKDFAYGMTCVFGNDRSEELTAAGYGEALSEPYEKLLVSICGLVDEYGDNSEGSFAGTILKIVVDIREERRHLTKRAHGFKGLAATAALPCLFVRFLGNWGMETIPSLISFYHGRGGLFLRTVISVLAFMCGMAVQILSDPASFRDRFGKICMKIGSPGVTPGKTHPLRDHVHGMLDKLDIRVGAGRVGFLSFIFAAVFFVIASASACLGIADRKHDLIYDTSDLENTLKIADSAQINAACRVIPYLMKNAVEGGMSYTDEELINEILGAGIRGEEEAGLVAGEFHERLIRYEDEGVSFSDIFFITALCAVGWLIPLLALIALGVALDSRVKEEVMQFEAVIDMEKDVYGMTVPIMLESMMCFASVTRGALVKTIMDYNTSGSRAFEHLLGYSNDRSLKRLVGFFSMTDMLGVRHAFDEISEELSGMREERRLDRSIRLEDEVMLAGILGVIPGGLVVFGYLLLPFIIRSLEMFNAYSDSLGMM